MVQVLTDQKSKTLTQPDILFDIEQLTDGLSIVNTVVERDPSLMLELGRRAALPLTLGPENWTILNALMHYYKSFDYDPR